MFVVPVQVRHAHYFDGKKKNPIPQTKSEKIASLKNGTRFPLYRSQRYRFVFDLSLIFIIIRLNAKQVLCQSGALSLFKFT